MSNLVGVLRQWWQWLVGESPLPGLRSRLLLAGTAGAMTIVVLASFLASGTPVKKASSTLPTPGTAQAPFSETKTPSVSPPGPASTSTSPAAKSKGRADPSSPGSSQSTPPASSAHTVSADPPTDAIPSAPTALLVTTGKGWSKISWSPPPASNGVPIAGYNVYLGNSPGGESSVPANGSTLIPTPSYTVTHLLMGTTYYFTVRASSSGGLSDPSNEGSGAADLSPVGAPPNSAVGMAALPNGSGYWLVNAQGAVSALGAAVNYGSASNLQPGAAIVQIAATPDGLGYWEVASDGEVVAFGDARNFGSAGGVAADVPVVGLAPTHDGQGYWEVTSGGGVFCFGDAAFLGPNGGLTSAAPIVGIAADVVTGGYWLVANDGAIFNYGAPSLGSPGSLTPNQSVIGLAGTPSGHGYWEVANDGSIFTYGDAQYLGAPSNSAPIVGLTPDASTGGYWEVASDGGVFGFGSPLLGTG
jgi:Fibronectin type III domain